MGLGAVVVVVLFICTQFPSEADLSEYNSLRAGLIPPMGEGDAPPSGAGDLTNSSSPCVKILGLYGQAASNFTECFIAQSRPLLLCEMCVQEYLTLGETYRNLSQFVDDRQQRICNQIILNADRILVVHRVHTFYTQLWTDSNCDACFDHDSNGVVYSKISEDSWKFRIKYNDTWNCFHENHSLSAHVNKSVLCDRCRPVYDKLNDFYKGLEKDGQGDLCMDIVDSMNITRVVWKPCMTHTKNPALTITIPALFLLLPICFYVGSKVYYQRKRSQLLLQKRMKINRRSSSSYVYPGVTTPDPLHRRNTSQSIDS